MPEDQIPARCGRQAVRIGRRAGDEIPVRRHLDLEAEVGRVLVGLEGLRDLCSRRACECSADTEGTRASRCNRSTNWSTCRSTYLKTGSSSSRSRCKRVASTLIVDSPASTSRQIETILPSMSITPSVTAPTVFPSFTLTGSHRHGYRPTSSLTRVRMSSRYFN